MLVQAHMSFTKCFLSTLNSIVEISRHGYKVPIVWVESANLTASYYKEYLGFTKLFKDPFKKDQTILLWKESNLIWVKSKNVIGYSEKRDQRVIIQTSNIEKEYSILVKKVRIAKPMLSFNRNIKTFSIFDCNGIEIVYRGKF